MKYKSIIAVSLIAVMAVSMLSAASITTSAKASASVYDRTTSLTLSVSPVAVQKGQHFTLSGKLTYSQLFPTAKTGGLGGKTVRIEMLEAGSWLKVKDVITATTAGSLGTFSWTPPASSVSEKTQWRAIFEGAPINSGSVSLGSYLPSTSNPALSQVGSPNTLSTSFQMYTVTYGVNPRGGYGILAEAKIQPAPQAMMSGLNQNWVEWYVWENGVSINPQGNPDKVYRYVNSDITGYVRLDYYPHITSGTVTIQAKYLGTSTITAGYSPYHPDFVYTSSSPSLFASQTDKKSLTWPMPTTFVISTSTTTPTTGKAFALFGTLKAGTSPLATQPVHLETHKQNSDGTWTSWANVAGTYTYTDGSGKASSVRTLLTTGVREYRWHYNGTATYAAVRSSAVTATVKSQPTLTIANSTTPKYNVAFTLSGTLKSGTSGLSGLSVHLERKVGTGSWADVSGTTKTTTTVGVIPSVSQTITTHGTYSYRWHFTGTATYQAGYSPVKTFTV